MLNIKTLSTAFLLVFNTTVFSQTTNRDYQVGHTFSISLPDYMNKTAGLNSAASIQYKSVVKDVYGFVIYDTKEELGFVEMNFSSINEFYEQFIQDFAIDEKQRNVSKIRTKTIGDNNFLECDVTYFDTEAGIEIYYLVGIVETKKSYYKVLSWTSESAKDKFKADFQSIVYSIKD